MNETPLLTRHACDNRLDSEQSLTPLSLETNEIHVWCVDAEATDYQGHEKIWMSLLMPDEVERARRYVNPTTRTLFVIGRCVVRHLLGRYLGLPAKKIILYQAPSGKLFVEGRTIQFNISHSGHHIVCALSHHPVGIDLEYQRPVAHMGQIVASHYSPDEVAAFRRISISEQAKAFFRLWTVKEAVVKAVGSGITDLNRFTVPESLIRGHSRSQKTVLDGNIWWVYPFLPAEDYSGALAVPMEHAVITLYDLNLRSL